MEAAEKVSVTITAAMMRKVRESVEAGEYASTSEAMRDALRLWNDTREERNRRLESIRTRIQASLDDPRPSLSSQEVWEKIEALYRADVEG